MLHSILSTQLVTALALTLAADEPRIQAPQHGEVTPARVVVVGASVSAGFGLSRELEANCTLTPFLRDALLSDAVKLHNLADSTLFLDPLNRARQQLESARELAPDFILGGDLPFWFGYGALPGPEARLARLERGLALLDELPCPIVIGDFPDMSPALGGSSPMNFGRPILMPEQVPSPEELERLNARLRAWAAERDDVHVFAMSAFVARLRDDEPLEVRGVRVAGEEKSALLQSDLLHPTVRGSALFTLLLLDEAVKSGLLREEEVRWDLEHLDAAAWEHTRAARDKKSERRRRREERKRKLEEREKHKQDEGRQEASGRRAA